jgi:hypothetical protein
MAGLPTPDQLRGALEALLQETSRIVCENGITPKGGSPAASDQDAFVSLEAARGIPSQVAQLVEVAGDHISAFAKLIAPPIEVIATWTAMRALLEAAARAKWLLEPGLDTKTRVARSVALRFVGLVEQQRFVRSAQPDRVPWLRERMNEVERDANSWGLPTIKDKDGKRIGVGVRVPRATDLIEETLGESELYRLMSAVAHGHHWAILALCYRQVERPAPEQLRDGYKPMKKIVHPAALLMLGATAGRVMGTVTWDQCLYYGWDRGNLQVHLGPVLRALGVPENRFPWAA